MDRKNELYEMITSTRQDFDLEFRKKISILMSSWEMGLNDSQAAAEMGVSISGLSNYYKKYPELKELKEICGEKLRIDARKNVREAIKKGHLETSKWYLERTDPEFQKKDTQTVNVAVISVSDREEEMRKFMERFTDAGVIETVEAEVGGVPAVGDGEDTAAL